MIILHARDLTTWLCCDQGINFFAVTNWWRICIIVDWTVRRLDISRVRILWFILLTFTLYIFDSGISFDGRFYFGLRPSARVTPVCMFGYATTRQAQRHRHLFESRKPAVIMVPVGGGTSIVGCTGTCTIRPPEVGTSFLNMPVISALDVIKSPSSHNAAWPKPQLTFSKPRSQKNSTVAGLAAHSHTHTWQRSGPGAHTIRKWYS